MSGKALAARKPQPAGDRREVIESPQGTVHAPKKHPWGAYMRRLDWRLTLCGQIAERGWSQRRQYGYVTCRSCLRLLERR